MRNLHLEFAYPWAPWLFLLLIPALGLTLFHYFRINKRFRKTRNRIVSMVLHMLVMTLCVCVLTGLTFVYEVTNLENEIILLVDVSDTEEQAQEVRDEFVNRVLQESGYDGFKVGVVTFGFTQQYAVPLTYDTGAIFDAYLDAPLPDTSATDTAAALRYTRTLFNNPETSKIVLITDGKETDEAASNVIRSVAAQGTKVDIAYIPSAFEDDNLLITGMVFPDYHVNVGETCRLGITVESSLALSASFEVYDNGTQAIAVPAVLSAGTQTVYFDISFSEDGLHELGIVAKLSEDSLSANNEYHAFYYLEVFNKILIIEHFGGQSEALKQLLSEEGTDYEAEVLDLQTSDDIPTTVEELRAYDQIILNNIANSDLPEGFDALLYSYVYDYGGGLLTTGGADEKDNAHAYNRLDMENSLYQQMLPVQAIDYTPPVGVVVIIDISGSMESEGSGGLSKKEWAIQGAFACLDALTERDYFGLMTLDTYYGTILPMTRRTNQVAIREAIASVRDKKGGATNFSQAIDRAGQALVALPNVDRRHIILVTDGMPGEKPSDYLPIVRGYFNTNEVTVSTIGIDMTEGDPYANVLEEIAQEGHGRPHILTDENQLLSEMREDLNVPEIKEVNPEPFKPRIENERSQLLSGVETGQDGDRRTFGVELGGFYGVRVRSSADLVLVGDYDVPLYAQWKFGAGTVGSFMSDLTGRWSSDFMQDANGKRFLYNVINNLMPTESLRPGEITVNLKEGNYINQLSVFTTLKKGEKVVGHLEGVSEDGPFSLPLNEISGEAQMEKGIYVTLALGAENNYSRCNFVVKKGGVYRIVLEKYDENEKVAASYTAYKSFAYSAEYGIEEKDEQQMRMSLAELAGAGGGVLIADNEDPYEIFVNFQTSLTRSYDPRLLFISLAMTLFLLDIVVRKFKFKWPHEIVRDYKAKHAAKGGEK